MDFRTVKIITIILTTVFLSSISSLANATDLMFSNDTNNNLSVRIDNVCLTRAIEQHSQKIITDASLQATCKKNICLMQIFNTYNCSGTNIENIILGMKQGIVSLIGGDDDGQGNQYFWKANDWNLYVSNH